jgi:hypothetical protein
VTQDRIPKGGKNVKRGVIHRVQTAAMRPVRVKRSRNRHLKNARRSCGAKFAEQLAREYARNLVPTQKHS